jgi:hypothetical protein
LDLPGKAELADWRSGRNAVYQLVALTVGARLAGGARQSVGPGHRHNAAGGKAVNRPTKLSSIRFVTVGAV